MMNYFMRFVVLCQVIGIVQSQIVATIFPGSSSKQPSAVALSVAPSFSTPSNIPSILPSNQQSVRPSVTAHPSSFLTTNPSGRPSVSLGPSSIPSCTPSSEPSSYPSTSINPSRSKSSKSSKSAEDRESWSYKQPKDLNRKKQGRGVGCANGGNGFKTKSAKSSKSMKSPKSTKSTKSTKSPKNKVTTGNVRDSSFYNTVYTSDGDVSTRVLALASVLLGSFIIFF